MPLLPCILGCCTSFSLALSLSLSFSPTPYLTASTTTRSSAPSSSFRRRRVHARTSPLFNPPSNTPLPPPILLLPSQSVLAFARLFLYFGHTQTSRHTDYAASRARVSTAAGRRLLLANGIDEMRTFLDAQQSCAEPLSKMPAMMACALSLSPIISLSLVVSSSSSSLLFFFFFSFFSFFFLFIFLFHSILCCVCVCIYSVLLLYYAIASSYYYDYCHWLLLLLAVGATSPMASLLSLRDNRSDCRPSSARRI